MHNQLSLLPYPFILSVQGGDYLITFWQKSFMNLTMSTLPWQQGWTVQYSTFTVIFWGSCYNEIILLVTILVKFRGRITFRFYGDPKTLEAEGHFFFFVCRMKMPLTKMAMTTKVKVLVLKSMQKALSSHVTSCWMLQLLYSRSR